ncbi:hypothetical protein ACHAXS_008547 [Conticribra weissflogii]
MACFYRISGRHDSHERIQRKMKKIKNISERRSILRMGIPTTGYSHLGRIHEAISQSRGNNQSCQETHRFVTKHPSRSIAEN